MPRRYYPPASLRYLKARLWNLARPGFWVTAIFLSAVGLVIKEYWTNPDFLTQRQKQQVTSHQHVDKSLSDEDKAIAADIDNLPVLYNDSERTRLPMTTSNTDENTQLGNSKGLSDETSKSQVGTSDAKSNPGGDTANSLSAPKLENPFLAQAENLLQVGVNSSPVSSVQPGVVPTSPGLGVGSVNQTNSSQSVSQSVVSVSPSQTTINQYQSTTQNLPSLNSNNTSTGSNSYVGQSPPANNSPSQIPQATTGVSRVPINPSTVTGYTQPPVINQPQNPYSAPNPYSDLQTRYGLNRYLNRSNNFSSGQALPTTSVVSPSTSAAPTYTTPYYTQTPSQGSVAPPNPAEPNNYSSPSLQPAQAPQSNLSYPTSQNPGQYPSGNGYSYP